MRFIRKIGVLEDQLMGKVIVFVSHSELFTYLNGSHISQLSKLILYTFSSVKRNYGRLR